MSKDVWIVEFVLKDFMSESRPKSPKEGEGRAERRGACRCAALLKPSLLSVDKDPVGYIDCVPAGGERLLKSDRRISPGEKGW